MHLQLVGVAGLVAFGEVVAQGPATVGSFAELLGQGTEQFRRIQSAPGLAHLEPHQLGDREVLEQRDDIGEGLVKGRYIRVRGILEAAMQAVEQGVGHLVGDDVAGQAGKHHAAAWGGGGRRRGGLEVAEQQRHLVGAVVGVLGAQRVGVDPQPAHAVGLVVRLALPAGARDLARSPEHAPAQGLLEVPDGLHRHRVDHLLVEGRVAFGGWPAILGQQLRLVQVHRVVEAVGRRVDVDDLEVFAHRSGFEFLPGDVDDGLVDLDGVQLLGDGRVKRIDAQTPWRGGELLGFACDSWALGYRDGGRGWGALGPAQVLFEEGFQGR